MKRFLHSVIGLVSLAGVMGLPAQTLTPSCSPTDIADATRLASAQAVAWFKARAAQDPEGWLIGPGRTNRLIGQSNVTVRYSMKMIDVPIYEYTDTVTFVQDSSAGPPRRVVEKRPVRQIGTNHVEQLVVDPNGSISKEQTALIWEPAGNIYWQATSLGDAALAVHALRRAGVPDTDPVIQQNLANLRQTIAAYGLPDQTWNLAWLTVVFAETPGREAALLTAQLASRLVDGQLRDGPGRGLWGPESFHHRLLAVVIRNYLAREAELKAANQQLTKRETAANRQAVEEATSALEREKSLLDSLTRQALRFTQVEFPYFWDENADPKVLFSGVRSFLYNQAAADLESTAVALLGLAAAAEHGRLPAQSLRPEPPKVDLRRPINPNQSLAVTAPPESALATLARAANALAARRTKDGRWDEANVHQPVTDFDTFQNLLPVPADAKTFIALESPVTPASVAQGAAAFTAIGRAVGLQKLSTGLRQTHDAGRAIAAQELAGWVAPRRPSGNQPAQLAPADYLTLPPVAELLGHTNLTGIVADELIRWLVLAGETNGCWRPANLGFYVSTSSRARLAALKTLKGQVIISSVDPVELQKAHIWVTNAGPGDPNGSPIARDAEGYATALVLLCLTSRLENPAAALVEFSGETPLPERRLAAHARLRQPPPQPQTVPVEPPAPATATDVPALPPPADHAPRPDEKF